MKKTILIILVLSMFLISGCLEQAEIKTIKTELIEEPAQEETTTITVTRIIDGELSTPLDVSQLIKDGEKEEEPIESTKKEKTFQSIKGYIINYPLDWVHVQVDESIDAIVYPEGVYNGDIIGVMITSIIIDPEDDDMNKDLYRGLLNSYPEGRLNVNINNIENDKIKTLFGDTPSFKSEYTFFDNGKTHKAKGIYTIYGNRLYLLEFFASFNVYNDFLDIGTNIMNSFSFTG